MSTSTNPGRAPGSKYGKRDCPALQSTISPADCGAQRGSKLACPASCSFFPFAPPGYELWLKVDGEWTGKSLEYVTRHWGMARFRDLMKRCVVPMNNEQMQLDCSLYNALYTALFILKGTDGRTLVEQWEAENWTGLNNDERVMMKHRRQGRPTVIEIQRVIDAQAIECCDALAPDAPRFVVLDRGVAASAARFTRIFTWLFRYPHFSRVGPNALEVPHTIWAQWHARIQERYQQAAQARPALAFKDFLAETVVECTQLALSLGEAHRAALFANLDFHHCVAAFRYTCPRTDLEAVLRSKPDFAPDEAQRERDQDASVERFIWLRRGESETFQHEQKPGGSLRLDARIEGVETLGNLQLSNDHLIFEALAKRKYEFGRRILDRYFGSLVQFEKESIRDLATIMAEKEKRDRALGAAERTAYGSGSGPDQPRPASARPTSSKPAADDVPPEVRRQVIGEAHAKHYCQFLDDAVPALGGLTPRAAAVDPQARPLLIDLMKQHVHNLEERNRSDDLDLKLDWVLEELGLRELL